MYLDRRKIIKEYKYIIELLSIIILCLFIYLIIKISMILQNGFLSIDIKTILRGLIIICNFIFLLINIKIFNIGGELKRIKEDDILYDVLDNQIDNQEVYIFTKEHRLIYGNKSARLKQKIKEDEMNSYKSIEKISRYFKKYLPSSTHENIKKSLEINGNWSGVLSEGLDEEAFLKITRMPSVKYETIEMVQIIYNKEIIKLKKMVDEKNRIFDIITQQAEDLIIIVDKNKTITYVNDEACNVLGYKKEELIGGRLDEFTIYDKSINITNTNKFEKLSIIKKDNSIVETETISSPINNIKDEGWILISRNITSMKELELLKEKYDEIKFHDQLKNDFFANLSHELKTPLNIFYSIIQLLDSKVEDDEDSFREFYRKYNSGLRMNFYRMFRMITNLIDLTKLDSNFEQVEFQNINIVKLCEDITLSVITYAQQKNIQIIFDTEEEERIIKCNGEYIERIMLNLLSNAIKFTPSEGQIVVEVSFDKEYIYINVKDNGIGIPKEKQEFIFEKFARIDKTLSRKNEGSGIGLNIVKSLVDLQGGSIILNSKEDMGSEFIIKLPNIKLECDDIVASIKEYEVDNQKITLELSDIYDVL